ncbi:DUF4407 domain-containing protein [Actinokineospora auranticolor]|uniref:Protein kinase-like protein n=1 Tax=Actinokineospora auranticolor TaxID=155976 RepID=A0A2S6GL05_9PSEU|nr:DUF4407 domain-containing protein [Actinokineospora auranticolor]PPK65863.1 protein kinase-like protein [Actinokineospora auranticolor]
MPLRRSGDFLYWCAGADPTVVDHAHLGRPERVRYGSIGMSVLLTGTAGGLSMLMVLGMVSHGFRLWHLPAALFWALFIFNTDRWLVSSINYNDPKPEGATSKRDTRGDLIKRRLGRLCTVLARIAMGVLIAFAVSEPVLLTMFESEITHQLSITNRQNEEATKQAIEAKYAGDFATIEAKYKATQDAVDKAAAELKTAEAELTKENADGNNTGQGCSLKRGSPCKAYQEAVELKQAELRNAQANRDTARETYTRDTAATRAKVDGEIGAKKADDNPDGLLARQKALADLTAANPELGTRVWLIRGVFLLVDLLPILLKTFASTSMYERFVRTAAADLLAGKQRARATADAADTRRAEADRVIDRARIDAFQDVRLEEVAASRDLDLSGIKLDLDQQRIQLELDHELEVLRMRWRHRERVDAEGLLFEGTEVHPGKHDPALHDVTEPGDDGDPSGGVQGDHPTDPLGGPSGGAGKRPKPDPRSVLNDRWVIVGPLPDSDQAGFSDLKLAYDLHEPEREVVVKRALTIGANRRAAAYSIKKDQHFHAKVRSRHVAPLLDLGEHELFGPFVVTPRYPTTLVKRLRDEPLTLEWSLRIMEQVLGGLTDLWRTANCVHLDIKPANIALDDNDDVKLIDFGLAKAVRGTDDLVSGEESKFTRWYAPLEQILRAPNWVSSACDVRAVGAVWYEMLTGLRPLHREARATGTSPLRITTEQFVELLRTTDPIRPKRLYPGLPASVDSLVMRWLSRDPVDRVSGPLGDRSHAELAREALAAVRADVEARGQLFDLIPGVLGAQRVGSSTDVYRRGADEQQTRQR